MEKDGGDREGRRRPAHLLQPDSTVNKRRLPLQERWRERVSRATTARPMERAASSEISVGRGRGRTTSPKWIV